MNTLLLLNVCQCSTDWTGFLNEMPNALIWITGIIAVIFLLKYLFEVIKLRVSNYHELEMAKEKDERERLWQLHNEIKKDLNAILEERIKDVKEDAKKEAKKEFEKNIKQEILEAEHDWYLKLLKDINGLKLDLKTEQKKDGES